MNDNHSLLTNSHQSPPTRNDTNSNYVIKQKSGDSPLTTELPSPDIKRGKNSSQFSHDNI